jgi:hypothetical protein
MHATCTANNATVDTTISSASWDRVDTPLFWENSRFTRGLRMHVSTISGQLHMWEGCDVIQSSVSRMPHNC